MLPVERRSELLTQLGEGIASLTTSDEWRRYLECQSRFHRYSFGNAVLIATQCPGASRVAGFQAWRKLGRSVRRGESAIWILAPLVTRKSGAGHDDNDNDNETVKGFRSVAVFDLSQTEGDELPTVCRKLTGDEPAACIGGLTGVANALGFTVNVTDLPDGVNGDCAFNLRRIRVEGRNSPAQQTKTLAHEIAHALLHSDEPDRRLAELEAESTAYVVCRCLGMDTAGYSFGYVATWAGGGARAVAGIKASCSRIQGAAAAMLEGLENLGAEADSDAA